MLHIYDTRFVHDTMGAGKCSQPHLETRRPCHPNRCVCPESTTLEPRPGP